jgi:hypothetical protein
MGLSRSAGVSNASGSIGGVAGELSVQSAFLLALRAASGTLGRSATDGLNVGGAPATRGFREKEVLAE